MAKTRKALIKEFEEVCAKRKSVLIKDLGPGFSTLETKMNKSAGTPEFQTDLESFIKYHKAVAEYKALSARYEELKSEILAEVEKD